MGSSYRDLQRAMDLVVKCYRLRASGKNFKESLLGRRRNAGFVSSPSRRFAARRDRGMPCEFLQHIAIANGSLAEFETPIQISERLGYVKGRVVQETLSQTDQVARMIAGLRKFLRSQRPTPRNQQPETRNQEPPA